jgi:hypothetical protein
MPKRMGDIAIKNYLKHIRCEGLHFIDLAKDVVHLCILAVTQNNLWIL